MKVLDHGFVEVVSRSGNMGASVIDAARVSFGSTGDDLGEKDKKLIAYLLGNGHTSPFRHAFYTFHIKMPLFVMRQWTKYQVGSTWREQETIDGEPVAVIDCQYDTDKGCSWNELSGRYKVMEPEFYVPAVARRNTGKQAANLNDEDLTEHMQLVLKGHHKASTVIYEALIEAGIAKELARLVLPPSIYSECYWTVSLQAVLHFLDQRLDSHAQFEIREYAQGVLELVRPDLEEMGVDL